MPGVVELMVGCQALYMSCSSVGWLFLECRCSRWWEPSSNLVGAEILPVPGAIVVCGDSRTESEVERSSAALDEMTC